MADYVLRANGSPIEEQLRLSNLERLSRLVSSLIWRCRISTYLSAEELVSGFHDTYPPASSIQSPSRRYTAADHVMHSLTNLFHVPAHGGSLMSHQIGSVSLRQKGSMREHANRRMYVLLLGILVVLTGPALIRAQQGSFSTIAVPGSSFTHARGINDAG